MRAALFLCSVVALCRAQAPASVDFDKLKQGTVMGGPTNDESLMPCSGDCLCEVPRKPQPPIDKSVTTKEIVIAWGKVSETSYCDVASHVQMKMEGSNSWVTVFNGPASQVSIRKIPVDTDVYFRLRERNCAGVGPFSDPLQVHTPSDKMRPAAPVLTLHTESTLCVTWQSYGQALVTLEMRAAEGDVEGYSPSWETVAEGITSEACADNLPSSTYFQFRIQVHDDSLDEPVSDAVVVKTDMAAPVAPLQPYLFDATDTSVTIRWTKPVTRTNRSPAQLFVVEVAAAGSDDTLALLEMEATTEATVTGTGTTQTNATSANSTVANTTSATKSGGVNVTVSGGVINGTVGGVNGSRVNGTGFGNGTFGNATTSNDTSSQYTFFRVAQVTKNEATVTGLQAGTLYAVRVRAVNARGESPPSPILLANTKPAAPGQVTGIAFAAATSDSVKLEWKGADAHGSAVVAYEVAMSPGGAAADFATVYNNARKYTHVTGLQPSAWYGFKVRAINAIGFGPWSAQRNIKTPTADRVLTDAELMEASKAMSRAALLAFLDSTHPQPTKPSVTARQASVLHSQVHLQLLAAMAPQLTLNETGRAEPDLASDHLSGTDIAENVPPPVLPGGTVDINGWCDPREGCNAKENTHEATACPNKCFSDHLQGFCAAGGVCQCVKGWAGPDCNSPVCAKACSNHGDCKGPGRCVCQPGFNDPDCASYWAAVFHAGDLVTRANVTALRASRLAAQHYTLSDTLAFPHLDGGVINMTQTPVVPSENIPGAIVRRTIRYTEVTERPTEGSYFAVPALKEFDFTINDTFTVSMWVRASDAGGLSGGMILSHGNFKHGPGYGVGMLPRGNVFCGIGVDPLNFRAQDLAVAVSDQQYADGRFHHIACRFNGPAKTLNLLIDGNEINLIQPFPWTGGKVSGVSKLDATKLSTLEPSAAGYPLVIGASYDFQNDYFDGIISDVRIWRTSQLYDEIRMGMWSPLSIIPPRMAFYIPLNDCSKKMVSAYRLVSGKAQAITFPNTVPECVLTAHPIAQPPLEEEQGVVLTPSL